MTRRAAPTGSTPAKPPSKREQLRAARETHRALRALAALDDLEQALAGPALERPRAFLSRFATEHRIVGWESPEALEPYRQVPERLPPEVVPLARAVLLDAARAGRGELRSRAAWCFDDLEDLDRWEMLKALADDVELGTSIADAWARYQRERAVSDGAASDDALAHFDAYRTGGAPIDAETRALLDAFRAVATIPASNAPEHARWMARWLLRHRPDAADLAEAAFWIGWCVDILRAGASDALAKRRAALEAAGDPYQALREAGCAALDWPWVRREIAAWRAVATDESCSAEEREPAIERLHGVGRALAVGVGQGRSADPRHAEAGKLRPILIGYCRDLRRERRGERTPVPVQLLEAGYTEGRLRREGTKWTPVKAADAILRDHFGLASERAAQRAATTKKRREKNL